MIVFYKSSFLKMVVFKMAVFQNDRFFYRMRRFVNDR